MAYGDPTDPTNPLASYFPDAGLLGNPLVGAALGLLSTSGPSLTPKQPFAGLTEGLALSSRAQQEAQQNALVRQKLAENARETAAQDAFIKQIEAGQVPGIPKENAGLFRASPEAAIKGYVGTQFMDPATKSQMNLQAAQLNDLLSKHAADTGETVSQTVKTIGNVKSIGEISQRLENSTLFAPGGPVDQADAGPFVAGALKAARAAGLPVDDKLIDQATDLSILSKATISMATNLQTVSSNLPRSGMAMQAIQTAVAAKMPWAAKREVLVPNMKAIFADIDEQKLGDKVPDYDNMKKVVAEWERQADAYSQRRAQAEGGAPAVAGGPVGSVPSVPLPPGYAAAPAPAGPAPMLPGSPAAALGVQNGNLVPQPAAAPVTTTPQAGVPGKTPFPMATNPRTSQPERVWPRPIDGERAIKAQLGPDAVGRTFIAINPQTGRPQVYEVTENNKGSLR